MCGLAGCITKKGIELTPKQKEVRNKIVRGLLIAMQERGHHSTGIAGVLPTKTDIVKQDIEAQAFVDTPAFSQLLKKNPPIILGHTRWASSGAITQRNAHPFDYGNIIGCHNGHVSNSKEIFKEHEVTDAEVDSEAIFYLLNEYKNDYKKALPELHGMFAITWIDLRYPNKVFLVRDGNPLFVIRVPELQTYFWASTEPALKAIVGTFFSLEEKNIWSPKPEEVYEFNTNFQIKKTAISFKTYVSAHSAPAGADEDADEENKEIDSLRQADTEKEIAEIIGKKSIVPISYFERTGYKNPFALTNEEKEEMHHNNFYDLMNLTIPQMRDIISSLTNKGCLMCDKSIDFQMDGGVYWHKTEKGLLCPKCKYVLEENNDKVIWIIDQDIEDMYIEVEAWEEEQRDLAYDD